ncbi:type 4a pilus biogenesis protein PilY1 [Simiduia litorea]|uniref:pilus assembly protein n=1 Tax=Simiduia litorea TaxID=1435348 RepID=UPI0036F1C24E
MKSKSKTVDESTSQVLLRLKKPHWMQYVAVIFCSSGVGMNAYAAPGELSKSPLFLTSEVPPNILMVVDDSGSMDWENLLTNDAIAAHGVSNTPESNSGTRYLNFNPSSNQERRELCVAYNAMAYDPSRVYSPWVGNDKDGNPMVNSVVTSARTDAFEKTGSVNLTSHWYYEWVDDNGDGRYQNNECKISDSDRKFVSSMTAAQQTNYANWYTFYRKREFVSKRALSEIITNSKARMGLATLHNNNSVGTLVADIDNISTPVDATAVANKSALLRNLFRINSSGGTPLRRTLEEAGKYYEFGQNPGNSFFGQDASTSPILSVANGGECQQNYTVLMSDGYWNGGNPSVGNTDVATNSAFDGKSYGDAFSNTLADVAMHYYERDLAPGYANKLPGSALDPNTAQHMVTYTVALGVNGSMTGAGVGGGPTDPEVAFAWPQPVANTNTTVDDMVHAAWNGRGEYLSANNTDELIAALGRAFLSIDERQGSASAVTFNSTKIDTDTYAFQAKFDSSGWHGDVLAYELEDGLDSSGNPDPTEVVGAIGPQQWSAADRLDARNLLTDPRQIVTFNGTTGIPFRAPLLYTTPAANELQPAQINDLLSSAAYPANTAVAAQIALNQVYLTQIVDYLRGVDTNEGVATGKFRRRFGKRLGDVVNSAPVFVAAPSSGYPDKIQSSNVSDSYDAYIKSNLTRTPMLYVGSNDGMLHGFDAETGDETFAYVPGLLYSTLPSEGLHYLAEQNYAHQPYADGSPVVGDVFISGSWRTYLVAGLNRGGKGIYVLDVTNPSTLTESFAANIPKLEFTHNNLGYTFSRPQIGRMNNGKWAAIFGNGYNNDPNGNGKASLFIVYLDGTGYKEITTGQGSIVSNNCANASSDCNGLSSPFILDHTGDARIDRAYAGDLHGNMWVFDLTDSNANNWGVAYVNGSDPAPLFQACSTEPCTVASRQPITSMPVLGVHPTRRTAATWPNLMVYFGTGQYIASTDSFTTATQSAYGIWDAGQNYIGQPRSKLVEQTITNGAGGRALTDLPVNYIPGVSISQYGWFEDFPDLGERTVIEMLVDRDVLFYATLIPENTQCSPGGTGYLMFVDRMNGGESNFVVVDTNNDGVFDDDLVSGLPLGAIPGGLSKISNRLFTSDSLGQINSYGIQTGEYKPSRRTSWSVIQ